MPITTQLSSGRTGIQIEVTLCGVCVHVCGVCVYVGRTGIGLDIFLPCPYLFFWKHSLTEPWAYWFGYAGYPAIPRDRPASVSPGLRSQAGAATSGFETCFNLHLVIYLLSYFVLGLRGACVPWFI